MRYWYDQVACVFYREQPLCLLIEDMLTALTAFIVLKVIAGVAVRISCSQSPQPGEVCYHAVGGTIHHS